MIFRFSVSRFMAASAAIAVLFAAAPYAGAVQDTADFEKLIKDKSPAYVTVKFVLKLRSEFGDRETESECTGVMIEPKGLVLVSNSRLGLGSFMRRFGGTATPTDIKVLIGEDTEGVEAKLLGRDTELDLAWVQIKEPSEKPYAFVDLEKAATPLRGQRLVCIRRMAKYFDRAFVVTEGRVAGRTKKPRDLFVPGGGMEIEPGLPVFAADGTVVGVVVTQMPDSEELEGGGLASVMGMRDMLSGLVLPSAEVMKATKRAKENPQPEVTADEDEAEKKNGDKKADEDEDDDDE